MVRVRCHAEGVVDEKGRLALPAPLRRALDEAPVRSLVLTHHQGSIWAFTPEDFEEQVEKPLAARDPFDHEVMDFAHALLAPAHDAEIDGAGRIRLPPHLRRLAGVEREVTVISMIGHIEIWNTERWTRRFEESTQRAAARSGLPRGGMA